MNVIIHNYQTRPRQWVRAGGKPQRVPSGEICGLLVISSGQIGHRPATVSTYSLERFGVSNQDIAALLDLARGDDVQPAIEIARGVDHQARGQSLEHQLLGEAGDESPWEQIGNQAEDEGPDSGDSGHDRPGVPAGAAGQ